MTSCAGQLQPGTVAGISKFEPGLRQVIVGLLARDEGGRTEPSHLGGIRTNLLMGLKNPHFTTSPSPPGLTDHKSLRTQQGSLAPFWQYRIAVGFMTSHDPHCHGAATRISCDAPQRSNFGAGIGSLRASPSCMALIRSTVRTKKMAAIARAVAAANSKKPRTIK